ncbi:MAG: TolC family protein [Bacteroidota bacterium]
MKEKKILLFVIFGLWFFPVFSQQDTLKISLFRADSLLLNRNLSLVAARYQVDAANAQAIQAKLFQNPYFSAELSLENPESHKFFDVSYPEGNKSFALTQLFQIAGQRITGYRLALEAAKMTDLQYFDLARSLKYQLHQSFFSVYYLSKALSIIDSQLGLLNETLRGYKGQYQKGNISMKDYSRLEASYLQLSNDKTGIVNAISENEKTLRVILSESRFVMPIPEIREIMKYQSQGLKVSRLVALAFENRPDLKINESMVRQGELNLSLQKRTAVPDLNIGVDYSQNGNYVRNYTGLTIGLPLPVMNRNKGNIRMASAQLNEYRVNHEQAKIGVEAEVMAAFDKLNELDMEYGKIDTSLVVQVTELNSGILENYRRKNISLLEFTDLFEAFSQSIIDFYQISTNRVIAFEELNYVTGIELFK